MCRTKWLLTALLTGGVVFSVIHTVQTSSNQPPAGHTGAPGDQGTCAKAGCHTGAGNPNNNSANILQFNFNNNNPTYVPGSTYNITVTNTGTNGPNTRWGFQATVLNTSNLFAGTLVQTDVNNTSIATFNNRTYIGHKNANNSVNSWTFQWTAPANNIGDVIFYVASNSANGIGSSGDIIYVDTFIIRAPVVVPPTADFTANTTSICQGQSVIFTDNSSADVTAWSWNFGSGASPANAIGKGPHIVTYATAGAKTISLTVTAPGGSSTETKNNYITVYSLPNAQAGNDVFICRGNSTTLNATGGVSYAWSPANGLSATNIANPTASPTATTTYTVTVTNANNCSATAQVTVTVINPPIASFSISDNEGCLPHLVTFTNTTPLTSSCLWNFADGNTSTACVASHVFNNSGTYNVSLTISDINGCTASTQQTVVVHSLPVADAGNDVSICSGGSALLNALGGITYSWNTGDTTQSIIVSPSANTTYSVTVTDLNGCTATDNVSVNISNTLQISVSNDTTICEGSTVSLFASGGTQFSWSPTVGLSNPNIANPQATPAVSTTYQVIVSDGVCTDSATVTITVTSSLNTSISADTTIYLSATWPILPLFASGGSNYQWSPSVGLDNPTSSSPLLDLSQTGINSDTTLTYTVIISDGACSDTLSVHITISIPVGMPYDHAYLSVYPNPSTGAFVINSSEKIMSVFCHDIRGRDFPLRLDYLNDRTCHVEVPDLPNGMYFLYIVTTQNHLIRRKIIIY